MILPQGFNATPNSAAWRPRRCIVCREMIERADVKSPQQKTHAGECRRQHKVDLDAKADQKRTK